MRNTLILTGGLAGTIHTFDAKTGAAGTVLDAHKGPGGVGWLAPVGADRVVSRGFDLKSATWDTKTGKPADDVKFPDLGLVVIDEEQRFGVTHKERLKQMRKTVDVLTMSATPIPRTLHMSMLGLRDISSLTTAPQDRRSVVTEVMPFDRNRVKLAILRELQREGQTYFVHNRVHNIL